MPPLPCPAFSSVRRTTASAEIVNQLRDLMASGGLRPGDRLPSERELSQALGVGRSTLREAIRSLESLELVEVRASEGTFLKAPGAIGKPDPLLAILFRDRPTQAKLFEVRKVLEPGLAALAARRSTFEQREEIRTALAEQEARLRRGEHGVPEDGPFHLLVGAVTENDILIRILESLIHSLRWEPERSHLPPGTSARLLREEWSILHAIEAREASAALHRMQVHLASIERLDFPSTRSRQPTAPLPST